MQSRRRFGVAIFLLISPWLILVPRAAWGHEEGALFSGAIIEPLKVHHAHIEDEQRMNFSFFDGFHEEEGGKRAAFSNSAGP